MLDLTWRFAVADASSGRLITLLDRRSTARKVTKTLNKSMIAAGTVPSDHPEINLVLGDGFPFLAEGVRNIYGFRKEVALPSKPWICRFGGRVLLLEDNVEESSGAAYTNWTAYDPRQLLYMRPVLTADGDLPGPNGVKFTDTPADEIVVALIQRTIDANGDVGIDMTSGTITPCPETTFHFEQGASVGDALDQLADANYADVFMDPVYDPVSRPAVLAELSVYPLRARIRHHAVFAWDQPSRSLVSVNRVTDGTQRANRIAFFAGQGGPAAGQVSSAASVAKYGEYWAQQFFPGQNIKGAAEALADEQLIIRKNGAVTFRVNPAPAQATIQTPVTLLDYDVGDCVPIYASSRFRDPVNTLKRVYEIPIVLRDDGTETVEQLSFADGVCDEDVFPGDGGETDGGETGGDPGGGGDPPTDDAYWAWDGDLTISNVADDVRYSKTGEPAVNVYGTGSLEEAPYPALPPFDGAHDYGRWYEVVQYGYSGCATRDSSEYLTGSHSIKTNVGTQNPSRCEIGKLRRTDAYTTDYYHMAVKFAPGWSTTSEHGCDISQLNYQNIVAAPFIMAADSATDSIVALIVSGPCVTGGLVTYYSGLPIGGGFSPKPVGMPGPLYIVPAGLRANDVWIRLAWRIYWSPDNDGALDCWYRLPGDVAWNHTVSVGPDADPTATIYSTFGFPTLQTGLNGNGQTITEANINDASHFPTEDKFGQYGDTISNGDVWFDSFRRATSFASAVLG